MKPSDYYGISAFTKSAQGIRAVHVCGFLLTDIKEEEDEQDFEI